MPAEPRLSALRDGLRVLMPGVLDTELLRACLWTGEPARQAWDRFQHQTGDLRELFRTDHGRRRCFGPLLAAALRRNGVSADSSFLTVLRTALVREELRAELYSEILLQTLRAMSSGEIPVLVLRGAAFGATLYSEPAHRHSHDIDLLVRAGDVARAAALLEAQGFKRPADSPERDDRCTLVHGRALPVNLLTRLLPLPDAPSAFDAMWERSREADLYGHSARILSPADNLFLVVGQVAISPARGNLQWAADAWLLIEQSPGLDWQHWMEQTAESRLTLPGWAGLEYLARNLHAGVSAPVRAALEKRVAQATPAERDRALYTARAGSGAGGFRQVLSGSTAGERARLLAWLLFPSASYMRSTFGVHGGLGLPAAYARRVLRYAVAALRSRSA